MTTESVLRDWRFGQTQAERLCAGVLSVEGYRAVDPQHPLGGPDGVKDVICTRGIVSFVVAVYFPPTQPSPREIKEKFTHDLLGAKENSVSGFIFIVNQQLTISVRRELADLSAGVVDVVEIYHLERLRAVLDSPTGCGLRLEYLKIPMTHEEQIAYWSSANLDVGGRLDRIEQLQRQTLYQLEVGTDELLNRTAAIHLDLRRGPSSTLWLTASSVFSGPSMPATSSIDIPLLLWLHRLIMAGDQYLPSALKGSLRAINVTIRSELSSAPVFTPPAPEDLPLLLEDWCEGWRSGYGELSLQDFDTKLDRICDAYFTFLRIHPFTDGNGRMARVILDQMLRELLEKVLDPSFATARLDLQDAITAAYQGDLLPLRAVLLAVLL